MVDVQVPNGQLADALIGALQMIDRAMGTASPDVVKAVMVGYGHLDRALLALLVPVTGDAVRAFELERAVMGTPGAGVADLLPVLRDAWAAEDAVMVVQFVDLACGHDLRKTINAGTLRAADAYPVGGRAVCQRGCGHTTVTATFVRDAEDGERDPRDEVRAESHRC